MHYDICEINGMLTRGGKRYFIIVINDYSRFTYVYLFITKFEAFEKFKEFKKLVEKKYRKVKILRSDKDSEYFSKEFSTLCEENRIIHQMTTLYTHNIMDMLKGKT